jgi:hypothetical protein
MLVDEIESIKSMFDSVVTVSDRDKQRALELVLQSRTFVRSDQLRAFLRYVCSMEIEGRGEQITEYRIAVEALGRSQDYATAEDSAVRNRAHALRAKLEELYTKELPDAPVRIDFFKGSYRPHFVVHKSPDENGSVASLITSAEMAKPHIVEPKLRVLGLVVAGLVLAFLAGVWFRGFVKPTPDNLIAEAWGPLFNKDGDVLVSVASHIHLQVRARSTAPPESERAVDAPPPVYEWYKKYRPLPPGKNLYLEFVTSSTRFGDAIGAAEVVRTIAAAGGKAQIFPEMSVSEAMFRDRNLVLIGMPENSSSIDRLLSKGSFRVLYDETLQQEAIVGPTATYVTQRDDASGTILSYGLVTVLLGQGVQGAQHRIMIFSGSHSSCTVGATEFMSSPAHLRDFRDRLRKEGLSSFPPAYQMVIRCRADRVVPLSEEYEAHVVLK